MRFEPLEIGRYFLYAGALQLVVMPLVGRLTRHVDARLLVAFGTLVVATSLAVGTTLTRQSGFWDVLTPPALRAAGLGFMVIPISLVALSDLPPAQRANAAGLFSVTRELGGSLGTALLGIVVSDGTKRHGNYLAEHIDATNPIFEVQQNALESVVGASESVPDAIVDMRVKAEALVLSFSDGFRTTAVLCATALILIPFFKRASTGAKPARDVR
jgi:DHA2 family multidrug resistance protein